MRTSISIIMAAFGMCSFMFAGVTGTLAGKIVDVTDEAPMAGVNVVIQETHLGAITDANGFYIITNIPAGSYSVQASMIGHQTVTNTGVVILPDLRSNVNFKLKQTAIEMEEVIITNRAPMIRRDITATTHFVSQEEIQNIPIKSFFEIIDIQPGVAAGHVRGGRKSELLYLVDGLPVQEAIEGKAGSDLPNSSIVELSLQTGGFNAEYGNAMSGVVNVITKEGSNKFRALIDLSVTDPLNNPTPFEFGKKSYENTAEFSFGGPIWPNKIHYYVAANVISPNMRWKDEQFGNRVVVMNSAESYSYNLNSKLSFLPLPNLKIGLQGLVSLWAWTEYDNKWKYNLGGLPQRGRNSYRLSGTLVHTLSPETFYEVRYSQYNVLKSIYGKSFREVDNLEFEDYNGDGVYDLNDWPGFITGGELPWWLDHQEIIDVVKVDWLSQVTPHHQLKSGIDAQFYYLYKKNVQAMYLPTYDPNFPLYITYDTEYEYAPWQFAWYFQDKIDYDGMVANIGLRWDYFDPTASRPALEDQGIGKQTDWVIDTTATVPAKPKQQFSPRLGIALPVTETDVLHINYGFFFQMPAFDYLYTNANLNVAEGFSPLGDPDLKPAKTIMWEVSYKGQFNESTMFDGTIFNKDVSNLVDANTFKNSKKSDIYKSTGFTRYVNLAMVGVRGFEFYIKRDYSRTFSGKISYTYMVAKGTGSSEMEKFVWTEKNYQVPTSQYYLSWDQRHTFVLNLDARSPRIGGLNLLWKWNSALPYTHNDGPTTTPNNERMDATTTIDIRINRDLHLGRTTGYIYLEALNLTDEKNVLWVDDAGLAGGHLIDPGAIDMSRRLRFGIGFRL